MKFFSRLIDEFQCYQEVVNESLEREEDDDEEEEEEEEKEGEEEVEEEEEIRE